MPGISDELTDYEGAVANCFRNDSSLTRLCVKGDPQRYEDSNVLSTQVDPLGR